MQPRLPSHGLLLLTWRVLRTQDGQDPGRLERGLPLAREGLGVLLTNVRRYQRFEGTTSAAMLNTITANVMPLSGLQNRLNIGRIVEQIGGGASCCAPGFRLVAFRKNRHPSCITSPSCLAMEASSGPVRVTVTSAPAVCSAPAGQAMKPLLEPLDLFLVQSILQRVAQVPHETCKNVCLTAHGDSKGRLSEANEPSSPKTRSLSPQQAKALPATALWQPLHPDVSGCPWCRCRWHCPCTLNVHHWFEMCKTCRH